MKYEFESKEELKQFIADNVITTVEVAEIMNCSRQYIDKLVQQGKLIPIRATLRDRLFLKSDILVKVEK